MCAVGSTIGGMLRVMIMSFGYLILRQVLQLIILVVRGERANAVKAGAASLRGLGCRAAPRAAP